MSAAAVAICPETLAAKSKHGRCSVTGQSNRKAPKWIPGRRQMEAVSLGAALTLSGAPTHKKPAPASQYALIWYSQILYSGKQQRASQQKRPGDSTTKLGRATRRTQSDTPHRWRSFRFHANHGEHQSHSMPQFWGALGYNKQTTTHVKTQTGTNVPELSLKDTTARARTIKRALS